MENHREIGYSAFIEAFFVLSEEQKFRVAKTNGVTFSFAEPQEFEPGTEGDLVVIVDGKESSRRVVLYAGVANQSVVKYRMVTS